MSAGRLHSLGRVVVNALGVPHGVGWWGVQFRRSGREFVVEVAAESGIEPELRDPNSPVLPLHHSATREAKPRVV